MDVNTIEGKWCGAKGYRGFMSYRVAIRYRGKTFPDIYIGIQGVKFTGAGVWPSVKLKYENGATFISTADITTIEVLEEEEDE